MNRNPPLAGEWNRRTQRVLLRIPIEVNGRGAGGKPFIEKTFTLAINQHGAQIHLKSTVRPDDQITITNLRNHISCLFRIVRKVAKPLGEHPEWGVESLEPEVNFWGMSFPGQEAAQGAELIDAVMECAKCNFRELARLTMEQYRSLITQLSLTRDCPKCKQTTEWKFGFVEAEAQEAPGAPGLQTAATLPSEKRRAKRFTVKLPVRIRLQNGHEEVARTENLSKFGVCFISTLDMRKAEHIQITVSHGSSGSQKGVRARVVWRGALEGTNRMIYGVELEEEIEEPTPERNAFGSGSGLRSRMP
jgi:hypothetical protein